MSYAYGTRGKPTGINQLGGLPRRRDAAALPLVEKDPHFSSVSLLLRGDENLLDSSATPKTITAHGNAAPSSAKFKFGTGSIYFDGNLDFVRLGKDPSVNTLTGDFTIECYVYRLAVGNDYDTIFSIATVSEWCRNDSGTVINGLTVCGGNSSIERGFSVNYSTKVPLNEWVHVACVRSGATIKIYINGSVVCTQTSSATLGSPNCSPALGVFDYYSGSYRYFWNGYIDEFRLTNGVARYIENFTPPEKAFPNA